MDRKVLGVAVSSWIVIGIAIFQFFISQLQANSDKFPLPDALRLLVIPTLAFALTLVANQFKGIGQPGGAGPEVALPAGSLPWNGQVSDSDPCQPVREQKMGGVIAYCKGKCATGTCGTLQSRRVGSTDPWKNDAGDPINTAFEYRCKCA